MSLHSLNSLPLIITLLALSLYKSIPKIALTEEVEVPVNGTSGCCKTLLAPLLGSPALKIEPAVNDTAGTVPGVVEPEELEESAVSSWSVVCQETPFLQYSVTSVLNSPITVALPVQDDGVSLPQNPSTLERTDTILNPALIVILSTSSPLPDIVARRSELASSR